MVPSIQGGLDSSASILPTQEHPPTIPTPPYGSCILVKASGNRPSHCSSRDRPIPQAHIATATALVLADVYEAIGKY